MKLLWLLLIMSMNVCMARFSDWKPNITEKELEITPKTGETCYQYAERKVNDMIAKYNQRRIVGTQWLSSYWAHHYEGALILRNNFWKAV